MSESNWMLPRLGDPEVAAEALDQVKFVLEQRPIPTATSSDVAAAFDGGAGDVEHLVELVSTLVHLSAVLALAAGRDSEVAVELLNVIGTHQRARADLASLDVGDPFGRDGTP